MGSGGYGLVGLGRIRLAFGFSSWAGGNITAMLGARDALRRAAEQGFLGDKMTE